MKQNQDNQSQHVSPHQIPFSNPENQEPRLNFIQGLSNQGNYNREQINEMFSDPPKIEENRPSIFESPKTEKTKPFVPTRRSRGGKKFEVRISWLSFK